MPVYEYECPKCQRRKEWVYQTLEEANNALVKCSFCRRTRMNKVFSTFTFKDAPKKPKAYF